MKLGVLAVSTLIGIMSAAPASFAQGDMNFQMSRSAEPSSANAMAVMSGVRPEAPRALESARPAAGMLPQQPTGPVQSATGTASNEPVHGRDIRGGLRRE